MTRPSMVSPTRHERRRNALSGLIRPYLPTVRSGGERRGYYLGSNEEVSEVSRDGYCHAYGGPRGPRERRRGGGGGARRRLQPGVTPVESLGGSS